MRSLAYILLLFLIIAGCEEKNPPPIVERDPEGTIYPDRELWDAEIIFTEDEQITSKLNANYIAVFENQNLTVADSGFRLDIYDSQGNHTSYITADSGVVESENRLLAYGDVYAVSEEGVVLRTERLRWDRARQQIISDTNVVLTTETDTLYGEGLVSDESLENWEVVRPRGKTVRELER